MTTPPNDPSPTPPPVGDAVEAVIRAVPEADPGALRAFLADVLRWNPALGLVSRREPERAVWRVALQSAALLRFVETVDEGPALGAGAAARGGVGGADVSRDGAGDAAGDLAGAGSAAGRGPGRVADVGSGAGFPGILWKLMRPELDLVLVERKSRRVAFLERTVRALGLSGVVVVERDAREAVRVDPALAAGVDAVAAIAVAPPPELGPVVAPCLRPGGLYVTSAPASAEVVRRLRGGLDLAAERVWSTSRFLAYRAAGAVAGPGADPAPGPGAGRAPDGRFT